MVVQLPNCINITSVQMNVVSLFLFFSDLPYSFQSALFLLCTCSDYTSAVRKGIEAGGCNCSRVSFIGACMAANAGLKCIPAEWIKKTHKAKEMCQLLLELFTQ